MKDEYEKLVLKIEDATHKPTLHDLNSKEFPIFSNIKRDDHASIIKVIWEDKGNLSDGLPHLVYISREKRPMNPHRHKAGAMNVLTRVSGVMTNAPFMLNVGCDMYANNPQIVMHAMCLMLGVNEIDSGFVQSPPDFYSGPGEPIQVFHQRNMFLRNCKRDLEIQQSLPNQQLRSYLVQWAGQHVEAIFQVWWMQHTELLDVVLSVVLVGVRRLVGYMDQQLRTSSPDWLFIQGDGNPCTAHPTPLSHYHLPPFLSPAFLGCAPTDSPTVMVQQKRWAIGILETLISRQNPLFGTFKGKLTFRGCLAYMWILSLVPSCIMELCYAMLPAYCIITNSYFLPKGSALCIPFTLFVIQSLYTLSKFLEVGASAWVWWNSQKMAIVISVTARLFGVFSVIMKHLRLSEPAFEITQKGQAISPPSNGGFIFSGSSVFVPATTISLVHVMALAAALLGFSLPGQGRQAGLGLREIGCSVWVVICFWPFVEGLLKRGRYGIPSSTICKPAASALLFVHFCRWTALE